MDKLAEFFSRFVFEFTWRRALVVLVMILSVSAGLLYYERTTSTFALSRLERAAGIVEVLSRADSSALARDADLERLHAMIASELEATLEAQPPSLDLPAIQWPPVDFPETLFGFNWVTKSLIALVPWILIAFMLSGDGGKNPWAGSAGAGCLGLFVSPVAAMVPTGPWWLHSILVPAGLFFLTVVLMLFLGLTVFRGEDSVIQARQSESPSDDTG